MSDEELGNSKSVKVLAYFLPQFHAIPENDEWWGKGFTEWTTIKKENKVSENIQPLNDNYYNLLDEKTVLWQTELAKEYGVYGFVYYHYYFCGKKLLEKPAENLLKNKSIDQKFCFCWANHDWNRSWEGVKTILLKQEYGAEEDWRRHFDYLLPFFLDERYIRIDGKPVFIVFNNSFHEKEGIFSLFNRLAGENGLNGIYLIETLITQKSLDCYSRLSDAAIIREPHFTCLLNRNIVVRIWKKGIRSLSRIFPHSIFLNCYSGNRIARKIVDTAENINRLIPPDIKIFFGAFTAWDNTSRHGIRGYKIKPLSKKMFAWYLCKLKDIAQKRGIEYLFFNAWNEWAEGMVLEPDKRNGYMFLEIVKNIFKERM
jgi:hypothetical protein